MFNIKLNNKSEDYESNSSSLVELEEPKLKKPSLYRVILLNDDYTPMEYVVDVLMKYFGKDKKGVYLEPANSKYKRIRPKRSLTIGGIVKAVVRKYS